MQPGHFGSQTRPHRNQDQTPRDGAAFSAVNADLFVLALEKSRQLVLSVLPPPRAVMRYRRDVAPRAGGARAAGRQDCERTSNETRVCIYLGRHTNRALTVRSRHLRAPRDRVRRVALAEMPLDLLRALLRGPGRARARASAGRHAAQTAPEGVRGTPGGFRTVARGATNDVGRTERSRAPGDIIIDI